MENQTQNAVGRPTTITPIVESKLITALQRGLSVDTACTYARVQRRAYYRKYKDDEEFRLKMDDARDFGKLLAGEQVFDVLLDIQRGKPLKDENGNPIKDQKGNLVYKDIPKYSEQVRVATAWKYLERKESDEFGMKNSFAGNVNNNQNNYFFVDDGQFSKIASNTRAEGLHKEELVEIVTSKDLGGGNAEGATMELHSD